MTPEDKLETFYDIKVMLGEGFLQIYNFNKKLRLTFHDFCLVSSSRKVPRGDPPISEHLHLGQRAFSSTYTQVT